MKSKSLTIAVTALALLLSGCSFNNNSNTISSSTTDLEFVNKINEVDDIYGFASMSATSLLTQVGSTNTQLSTSPLALMSYSEITDADIEKINGYLNMFEGLLSDDGVLSTTVTESDLEGYAYKMVVATKSLLGEVETYTMYYNEVIISDVTDDTSGSGDEIISESSSSTDITSDSTDAPDPLDEDVKVIREFDREKDDEDEVSTKLEGIMIINDVQYEVIGRKEVEQKEDEVEVKTSFISRIDQKNYVKVTQKLEEEDGETQQKFSYEVVENGIRVSTSEVKVKQENENTKIELKIFENDQYSKYEFKQVEENGAKMIMIKVQDNDISLDIKVYVVVDEVTGETTYSYKLKDGKEFHKDRHHEDDEDDDDEKEDKDEEDEIEDDEVEDDEVEDDEVEDESIDSINNSAVV